MPKFKPTMAAGLALSLLACGPTRPVDNTTGGGCTLGQSIACTCTSGATGAQVCETGGSFSSCVCGNSPDAGGNDGGSVDGGPGADSGPGPGADGGSGMDAGSVYVVTTLTNAWGNLADYSGGGVEIENAIVVASNTYTSTSTTCTTSNTVQTFYIQDQTGGPGVAVYRACNDVGLPFPNIGDIVTVQGELAKFDGSLQISTYAKLSLFLGIVIVAPGGGDDVAMSGAYPPAGMPAVIASSEQPQFANSVSLTTGGHPELLGTALHFGNVAVTSLAPLGFTDTLADGGSHVAGFEITNGIWVDYSNVYSSCVSAAVADGGTLALPTGVTGMWDRYQDYYGKNPDGGFSLVYPVLIPQQCSDIGL